MATLIDDNRKQNKDSKMKIYIGKKFIESAMTDFMSCYVTTLINQSYLIIYIYESILMLKRQ